MAKSHLPSFSRWQKRIFVYGSLFTLLAASGVTEQLFYHPSKEMAETPASIGQAYEDLWFESQDGTRLHGWLLKPKEAVRATIIHFHGNAINIANHYRFVDGLTRHGYQVMVFDYRGYGQSEGRPTRKGIQDDAAAAIAYAGSRPDVDPNRILLFAQSLGVTAMLGGWVQAQPRVCGMVLDSGFTSYHAIAGDALRKNPVSTILSPLIPLLIRGGVDADQVIDRIPSSIPLLFQHGDTDRVIPIAHSVALHKQANGEAAFITYAGSDHVAAPFQHPVEYERDLLKFFDRCLNDTTR